MAQNHQHKMTKNDHVRHLKFLINPAGDLRRTQKTLTDFLGRQKSVQTEGFLQEVPSEENFVKMLQAADIFLYAGHGSGEQFFSRNSVTKSTLDCLTLLMGCSSGKLSQEM